jgi:hypothetical protein
MGTTYYIAVGGFNGAQGSFDLAVSCTAPPPMPADECANAPMVSDGTFPGTTVGSTASSPTGNCVGTFGPEVWYCYVAPCTGTATASLCAAEGGSATYDSALAAFSGTCASLTQIACNDDFCGLQSRISFAVTQGQTYYIAVGSFGANTGSFSLNLSCVGTVNSPPTYDPLSPCGSTLTVAAGNPLSYTVTAVDVDVADMVTLDAVGVPAGAMHTPSLPTMGNPVSSTFDWTPTVADAGTYVITYSAFDGLNMANCTVTIEVEPCTSPADSMAISAPCGATMMSTPPVLGGSAKISIDGNLANAPGIVFFNAAPPGSTLVQGCEIVLTALQVLTTFTTDASGDASIMLQVPSDTSRCGFQFVLQGVIVGPGGPLTIGEVTNGVLVTFGS